jgi:shikimate kinase
LLTGDVAGNWKRLASQRAPHYEEVATIVVDTAGRTPAQVAAEIVDQLTSQELG